MNTPAHCVMLAILSLVFPACAEVSAEANVSAPAPQTALPSTATAAAPAPAAASPVIPQTTTADAAIARADATLSAILGKVVTADGLVRYDRLRERRDDLNDVVEGYAKATRPSDPESRLALWINAYNANVLAKVLAARAAAGFETVVKVPGFFDETKITVAGEALTLNDLENKRVRPEGDARIHAALVCAAMSCPPLRSEPYAAARLDRQLDDQCRRWINDRSKFRVVDGTLGLSEILKWYGEDFQSGRFTSLVAFVRAYADPGGPLARYIGSRTPVPTVWLPYDWTLNDAR